MSSKNFQLYVLTLDELDINICKNLISTHQQFVDQHHRNNSNEMESHLSMHALQKT